MAMMATAATRLPPSLRLGKRQAGPEEGAGLLVRGRWGKARRCALRASCGVAPALVKAARPIYSHHHPWMAGRPLRQPSTRWS